LLIPKFNVAGVTTGLPPYLLHLIYPRKKRKKKKKKKKKKEKKRKKEERKEKKLHVVDGLYVGGWNYMQF